LRAGGEAPRARALLRMQPAARHPQPGWDIWSLGGWLRPGKGAQRTRRASGSSDAHKALLLTRASAPAFQLCSGPRAWALSGDI